ncbi:MAG: UDP-N-acetylmuramate dehydrogenase [Patescibacteria group bacterium]|nr:UDP-N-acetylmuramate dehydrogenase [Patescibacteria group bacterium]
MDITPHLSLMIGGTVSGFDVLKLPQQIPTFVSKAQKEGESIFILGGGTNTIFSAGHHQIRIGKMTINKLAVDGQFIRAGAGVMWDKIVETAVAHNLSGIEALSAIPGTAGAGPIQNIGAYGQEISHCLDTVIAYDTLVKEFIPIKNHDCGFGYRSSIFKENPRQFVISEIILKLKKNYNFTDIIDYPGVREYMSEHDLAFNLQNIRAAIIEIRSLKLPNPATLANAGSFFKNPYIDINHAKKLKKEFPDLPQFPTGENLIKIPAGWLIEKAGLKGIRVGDLGTYDKNALVLVNYNQASFNDLEEFIKYIQSKIQIMFGVELIPEVNIIR